MPLVIYNTRTRAKAEFEPLRPGHVGIYVCGVTPYDFSHIGHARAYVAFDVVVRWLRRSYDVVYVRNYTDVDDKIIKRANEQGVPPLELSARFIRAYQEDMAALNVLPADHEPKVSDTIQEIIRFISDIIANGHAYAVDGDVYYEVATLAAYGSLSGRDLEDLKAGARVEVDERKRKPLDFALWKAAKPGEPSWESPWGPGRPGWHIECSAMSRRFLGDEFDIHGGGKDLLFPHHENECAQSEAVVGRRHVRIWMHNGFVNIDNEKMSKSLGNFFTIRDVLKRYHGETVRLFLLTTHYRSPINYSDTNLDEARKRLDYFYDALAKALTKLGAAWNTIGVQSDGMYDRLLRAGKPALRDAVAEAMDDDFNAPKALGELSDLFRDINALVDGKGDVPAAEADAALADALRYVRECGAIFGLWQSEPAVYLAHPQGAATDGGQLGAAEIEKLIEQRNAARKNKDFAAADAIRKQLGDAGVEIKDTPQGTSWKYAR